MKKLFYTIILCITLSAPIISQSSNGDWVQIPGFIPENPAMLRSTKASLVVLGLAGLSYGISEFFGDFEDENYYQVRAGMNNEYFWGFRKMMHQNFGVERRVSSWFSVSLEANLQEWYDDTPNIKSSNKFGAGLGIMSYYRWYILGSWKLSPYIEYGLGVFCGFKEFPYNGTNLSFNYSTQLGIEYKYDNNNRFRFSYGQFHQSTDNYSLPNPGYDADGFSIGWSWKMF
jgi:hypothetical protein